MPSLLEHFTPTLTRMLGRGKPKPSDANEQEPGQQSKRPMAAQITDLDDNEMEELVAQIKKDYQSAYNANISRQARFRRYLRETWRNDVGMSTDGGSAQSNMHYPLVQSQVLEKLAREHQALFGEDAGVKAVPTRPVDDERVAKVGAYVRWVVFQAMPRFMKRWGIFQFRRLLLGRAHAKLVYKKFYHNHPTKKRVCYLECPDFEPIHPDDIFTPGEEFETEQDASFIILRYWTTPEQMRRDEEEKGTYFGIAEDWDAIEQAAKSTSQRDIETAESTSESKTVQDQQQGVRVKSPGFVEVHEWYGRWRLPKESKKKPSRDDTPFAKEASPDSNKEAAGNPATSRDMSPSDSSKLEDPEEKREEYETDLLILYLPKIGKIKGILKLDELYPDTPNKRPIFSANMINDGTYWSPGVAELLESFEKELTVNENLFTTGVQFSVGPLGFYKPASGANPDILRYEPNIMIPSDNPQQDVHFVMMPLNPTGYQIKQQSTQAIVERLMGSSDFSAGRNIQRPSAPKTARATMALLERGDLRVGLDTSYLLVDFARFLRQVWDLCSMYAPEEQFFRVTGEDADELFETDRGFGKMTAEEFGGEFDFELKPAIGVHAKEAHKDDLLQFFGIAIQHPLFQTNAYAAYMLLQEIGKVFKVDVSKLIPKPQKPEISEDPREEWLRMLKGEPVTISPADDDAAHIADHQKRLQQMWDGEEDQKDHDAMDAMMDHIQLHVQAQQQKQAAMAMTQALMAGLQQTIAANGNRFGEPAAKEKKGGKGKKNKQPPAQGQPGMPGLDGQGGVPNAGPGGGLPI